VSVKRSKDLVGASRERGDKVGSSNGGGPSQMELIATDTVIDCF